MTSVVEKAFSFAREDCAGKDPSHDFYHVQRVTRLALVLAKEEGVDDLELVELASTDYDPAALLHDVKDYKYSGSDTAAGTAIAAFLLEAGYPKEKTEKVVDIVTRMGFKNEVQGAVQDVYLEFAVVQDADRLDAIGAFGIARTFCFGATKKTPIYDPNMKHRESLTEETYTDKNHEDCTVNHFYEKLLKLKDLMKTKTGKAMAAKRHQFIMQYLEQLYLEYDGKT